MTQTLHFHFSLWCIGEESGNPLQCSYLENPRDSGAWWAAVYGVAQSRTRLKWLSSNTWTLNAISSCYLCGFFFFFLVVVVSLLFCFFNKHSLLKKIYLAVPGLRCGTQAPSWGLQDLVPWPGTNLCPLALGVGSLNHWTTRGVPHGFFGTFALLTFLSLLWSCIFLNALLAPSHQLSRFLPINQDFAGFIHLK